MTRDDCRHEEGDRHDCALVDEISRLITIAEVEVRAELPRLANKWDEHRRSIECDARVCELVHRRAVAAGLRSERP